MPPLSEMCGKRQVLSMGRFHFFPNNYSRNGCVGKCTAVVGFFILSATRAPNGRVHLSVVWWLSGAVVNGFMCALTKPNREREREKLEQ